MARPCLVVVEMNGSYLGEVSNEAWKRETDREVHQFYAPFSAECGLFSEGNDARPCPFKLTQRTTEGLSTPAEHTPLAPTDEMYGYDT
jgi:hypothetical protein